jgi:hypothetical protein
MHVVARFRPMAQKHARSHDAGEEEEEEKDSSPRFYLPLHQRLQLIRARDKSSEK